MQRFKRYQLVFSISVLALILTLALTDTALAAEDNNPAEQLRSLLEAPTETNIVVNGDMTLFCTESLRRFYDRRGFTFAWIRDRKPTAQVDSLLDVVRAAGKEGLDRFDYHLVPAKALLKRIEGNQVLNDADLVDLDLLLTDTFLLLGSHFLAGRLDPESIDPMWTANRRSADLATILEDAQASGSVAAALRGLLPPQPGYRRLRTLLQELRTRRDQGGWPIVSAGAALKLGNSGPRVLALASRLREASDPDPVNAVFDEALAARVQQAQLRYGLEVDGVVGPATLAALNVPIEDRIAQVMVNMERWRWLPQVLGRRYLLVNIANQQLQAFVDGKQVFESAIVVGRAQRKTPVFSSRITHLVFRPFWEVPPSMAVKDKLPELRKDPQRLVDQGFQVLLGWEQPDQEVDPLTVDWNRVSGRTFPYRLRQKPGPQNALGSVKILFPNKYNVYIHDTPDHDLFSRSSRTFSSGCIRVEKPAELAFVLLADQPEWTMLPIETAMTTGQDQLVRLKSNWLVHLEYWTAWVEEDGTVQFRNDIYRRDARVLAALREAPVSLKN